MQYCGSMCVCNQKNRDWILKYVNYTYRIWLLNLPVCGVCAAWRADWDWVTERVQGFVTCLLFLIRDWCHGPVVHWLVSCFDRKVACKRFPSNSCGCPCGMILKALRFLLWFRRRNLTVFKTIAQGHPNELLGNLLHATFLSKQRTNQWTTG